MLGTVKSSIEHPGQLTLAEQDESVGEAPVGLLQGQGLLWVLNLHGREVAAVVGQSQLRWVREIAFPLQ